MKNIIDSIEIQRFTTFFKLISFATICSITLPFVLKKKNSRGFIQFLPMIILGVAAVSTFIILGMLGRTQDIRGRAVSGKCANGAAAPDGDVSQCPTPKITPKPLFCTGSNQQKMSSSYTCVSVDHGTFSESNGQGCCTLGTAPAGTATCTLASKPTCLSNGTPKCTGTTWSCPAVTPACTSGKTQCSGTELQTCSNGIWISQHCANGCANGSCNVPITPTTSTPTKTPTSTQTSTPEPSSSTSAPAKTPTPSPSCGKLYDPCCQHDPKCNTGLFCSNKIGQFRL